MVSRSNALNRRFCTKTIWRGAVILAALGVGAPAFAQGLWGDGSSSNNPDLLRGGFDSTCVNYVLCDKSGAVSHPTKPRTVSKSPVKQNLPRNLDCTMIDPADWAFFDCAPPQYAPVQPPVADFSRSQAPEPDLFASKFEADWQVVLRGSYENGSTGSRFGIEVLPEVSVSRGTASTQIDIGANARVQKEGGDAFRLSGAALEFDAAHLLNSDTGIATNLSLDINQDSAYAPGTAAGIVQQPIAVSGAAALTVQRRAGRFGFELGANAGREIYSATLQSNGVYADNSDRNRTSVGGNARVEYEATDRVKVFVEGDVDRDIYDIASPSLGTTLNSWTYAVRAGLSGDWDEVYTVNFSAGYGLRRFDSSLLNDVPVALASAELTYRPDETLDLSALFETNISAPSSTATSSTQIDYSATATARYSINDRFAVRGNLGGQWTQFTGTGNTETTYSVGVGADYNVNKQTALNADYSYRVTEGSATPRADNHRVSLGVTHSR